MPGRKYTGFAKLLIVDTEEAERQTRQVGMPHHYSAVSYQQENDHLSCTWYVNIFVKRSVLFEWISRIKSLSPYIYGDIGGVIDIRTFDSRIVHFVGNEYQIRNVLRKHLDQIIPEIYDAASEHLVINELEGWLQRYYDAPRSIQLGS